MLHRDLSRDKCASHSHPWGKMYLLALENKKIIYIQWHNSQQWVSRNCNQEKEEKNHCKTVNN